MENRPEQQEHLQVLVHLLSLSLRQGIVGILQRNTLLIMPAAPPNQCFRYTSAYSNGSKIDVQEKKSEMA